LFVGLSQREEVIFVLILHNGVLLLAALNLAVNAALGLVVLLHYPYSVRPIPARRFDRGYEKPDLKTTEKGETSNEQSLG
jgi:hypothetical protein